MNESACAAKHNKNLHGFIQGYVEQLNHLLCGLDLDEVSEFVDELISARANANTVFFIGNGGSAATASHMSNDFGVNLFAKRPDLPPIKALSLTDNTPAMLAIANDEGYHKLFVSQLKVFFEQGDKLVAISASGNSPNVVEAARWVKQQGGRVIALVGFDGGELAKIADIVIHAATEKGQYGPVEDVHMILDHLIVTWLIQQGSPQKKS